MVNSVEFAKRIEKILSYYGISATAFAVAISFNRSTISHILSGRNKPSLEFVLKIVETYPEVELYWLLNGKGSFPPSEISNKNISEVKKEPLVKNITSPIQEETIVNTTQQTDTSPRANNSNIDRIVIFYSDGSFKEYLP
ncbi:putative DNA-binding protein [unidentified eubacterium SCB49]|nr:putative DNA-binding protein [unidentified eubacterium SCB49]